MERQRLEGLDLLRGVAAIAVMLLHLPHSWPLPDWPFAKAYLAVDFFFMLSGYVLTRTYHARFAQGLTAWGFMGQRIRRLWPVIAVGTVVGLLTQLEIRPAEENALFLLLGLAIIPYWAGTAVFPLNGVIWSIFFELAANLVHATVLARLSRTGIALLAATLALVMGMIAAEEGTFDLGAQLATFPYALPRVLLAYGIGCWLQLATRDQASFAVPGWAAPLALAALLVAGWAMGPAGWRFDLAFVMLACPAILLAGLADAGRLKGLGAFLGDLSFPLYAVHMPVLHVVAESGLPWFAAPPIALAAAWLVAALTGARSPAARVDWPRLRRRIAASG